MVRERRINVQNEMDAQQKGNGVIYRRNWSGVLYVNHIEFKCSWRLVVRRHSSNTLYRTVVIQCENNAVYIDNQERTVGDLIERALLQGILGEDIVNKLYNHKILNEENIMPIYESPLLNAVDRVIEIQVPFDEIDIQLQNGHDINTTDVESGDTALHLAARANKYELVEWLLDKGSDHRIRNKNHDKPKEEAIRRNNPDSWETVTRIEDKVKNIKAGIVKDLQQQIGTREEVIDTGRDLLTRYKLSEQRIDDLEWPTPASMVRDLYRCYLKRDPEPAPADLPEGVVWGDALRIHGYSMVEKGVRESQEARDRVGQYGLRRYMNNSKL